MRGARTQGEVGWRGRQAAHPVDDGLRGWSGAPPVIAAWDGTDSEPRWDHRARRAAPTRCQGHAGDSQEGWGDAAAVERGRRVAPGVAGAVGDEEMQCGCQLAREPGVCRQATMPTANSGSLVSVRLVAVTVWAATRAISPSTRQRYEQ